VIARVLVTLFLLGCLAFVLTVFWQAATENARRGRAAVLRDGRSWADKQSRSRL
jgi:hypothetical protein